MSSFTEPLVIMAVPSPMHGVWRFLPPGFRKPKWELWGGFTYCVGSLSQPSDVVFVPNGFVFDGASVPFAFRVLLPMAHPNYIQAAALHDWMLSQPEYSRRYCDDVFFEALGVLGVPRAWRVAMFCAVRLGALRWRLRRLLKGSSHG